MLNLANFSSKVGQQTIDQTIANQVAAQLTEAQAIHLRKAAATAILAEFAQFQYDKGATKIQVLRAVEEQANLTTDSLLLPSKMTSDIVTHAMDKVYRTPLRRERMMETMIEGIKEINREDPGGDDAGMGLPQELKGPASDLDKFDKVIDESSDLVVERGGNKFIETALASMCKHLPKDFLQAIA